MARVRISLPSAKVFIEAGSTERRPNNDVCRLLYTKISCSHCNRHDDDRFQSSSIDVMQCSVIDVHDETRHWQQRGCVVSGSSMVRERSVGNERICNSRLHPRRSMQRRCSSMRHGRHNQTRSTRPSSVTFLYRPTHVTKPFQSNDSSYISRRLHDISVNDLPHDCQVLH